MKLMRKVLYILIVLTVVLVSDRAVGFVSRRLMQDVPDVGVNQTNSIQALFKRKADVLVLGTSRANHSFVSQMMEDSLRLSVYNAGRDGQNIIYSTMVLDAFLERCQPKIVVLDATSSSLDSSWMPALKEMTCYYGISPSVDRIIDDISTPLDKLKMRSDLYKYNNSWQWLLQSRLAKSKEELDGYRPMAVVEGNNFKAVEEHSDFHPDKKCMAYFRHIIQVCRERGIRLYVTYTPSLTIDRGNFNPVVRRFCQQQGVPYLSWNGNMVYCNHSDWFYDATHLNDAGAHAFTAEFCKLLNHR